MPPLEVVNQPAKVYPALVGTADRVTEVPFPALIDATVEPPLVLKVSVSCIKAWIARTSAAFALLNVASFVPLAAVTSVVKTEALVAPPAAVKTPCRSTAVDLSLASWLAAAWAAA